ncbi:MAG: magnesium transporter [Gammaproteobacteria bacterium RIFOXYA12_FULL_61_12]|nr:MAG: magnesium transporter [Gammaproteobacteria bacterium RIFOXYD12_FULL_61_37]OGT93152.1 MAG: magnesium transporter [Gammaproteobacteria bacterium RIFOXYA12_FULL_61_12]
MAKNRRIEKQRLDHLQEVLDSGALREAGRMLNALHPAEAAHLLESLPQAEREIVWGLVNEEQDGEILLYLSDEVRDGLIQKMDLQELLAAAENLDLDDLADLLQELPRTITRQVLDSLDYQYRSRLESVLHYPEDTAGGLMNLDIVTVRPEVSLDVVLRYLRRLGGNLPAGTDSLIVINRESQYLGTLSITDLLTHDPGMIVAEVMKLRLAPIPAETSARDVANRFEQQDLISAPVVDGKGRVLGRITIDDVVDVIREEGEHQFMGQAGLSGDEDMFAPVIASTKRRALWLGINLLTALLASWVIGRFEHTIEKVVALAVLMPIVASMGGVAGTQTLTLAVRGLALGQISGKNARVLLYKELAVGVLNGLIWASVVALVAGFWFQNISIALLIAAALVINLAFAAFTGAVLPLLLDRIGIDPALAGGVLLTTVTDVVGFFAFLGLATLFLL